MRTAKSLNLFVLVLILVLPIHISTLSFADTNVGSIIEEQKINKLLIIVLLKSKVNRTTLENELAEHLSDYGISTAVSHKTRLMGMEQLNKKDVLAACQKTSSNGVLVVRLVDSEDGNSYSYNERSQYTGAGMPSSNSSGIVISGGKTYSWGDYAYGNYFDTVSSTRMDIQSDIYHIDGVKQLMTDDIIIRVDPNDEEKSIGIFAKKLSKKISKQKYIVRE